MIVGFVVAYLVVSLAIGLYAARRVASATDFAAAGRRLPLAMVVATVFATWFGAETVLGIPPTFVREDLRGVVSDPFGTSIGLVLVALFFAARWYRLNLLTIGDYFRLRYGRAVEVTLSICIVIGYLGWTAAQFVALGLVFHVISGGAMAASTGMLIGAAIVLAYTIAGGMWSIALTDFVQMIVIVAGLGYLAWLAADMAGGAANVIAHAAEAGKFRLLPERSAAEILAFAAAALTLMLGGIPQQDTWQRVTAARDARTAALGTGIGGGVYLVFALIPMFLAYSAALVDPAMVERFLAGDAQMILPTLVMERMPPAAQVLFFGALLSAIMSSASAALLAPAVSLAENVVKPFRRATTDRELLALIRIAVALLAVAVLAFALDSESTIFEMVENAYKVTLVSAFVPLAAGMFWSRASTAGAALAIVAGLGTWLACEATVPGAALPPQLAGLGAAIAGMLVGSLLRPRTVERAHAPRIQPTDRPV